MHSDQHAACTADVRASELSTTDLRHYLEKLAGALDASSLQATLKLMMKEWYDAIRVQEGLVAMAQLCGRATDVHMDRLRGLRCMQDEVSSMLAAADAVNDDEETESTISGRPLQEERQNCRVGISTATYLLSRSFLTAARGSSPDRGAYRGSIPAAGIEAPESCAEPAFRHRAGRRVLRRGG